MPRFLTDEWFEAVIALQAEYAGKVNRPAAHVRMNQVVTDVPFGVGSAELHTDTSTDVLMGRGLLDDAEVTVTTDYDTARTVLVDRDQQAAMQAFMSGKIQVQGDMTKLMAMQGHQPNEASLELIARIKDLTE